MYIDFFFFVTNICLTFLDCVVYRVLGVPGVMNISNKKSPPHFWWVDLWCFQFHYENAPTSESTKDSIDNDSFRSWSTSLKCRRKMNLVLHQFTSFNFQHSTIPLALIPTITKFFLWWNLITKLSNINRLL